MKDRVPAGLHIAVVIYTALFFFFCSMRSLSSCYGDADLGIFGQSFYTAAKCGEIFYNTFESGSHFQLHNSPIFYVILPLYSIHPSLYTLLFIMTCALAAGAYPVFLIARERLGEKGAFLFALLYLLYHPLHGVNYDQFNELAFSVTPMLFSFYFMEKKRFGLFWICAALVLMVKEETAITLAVYGIYIIYYAYIQKKNDLDHGEKRRYGVNALALMAVSLLYLYLSLYVIIPHFRQDAYSYVADRYGAYGNSIGKVAVNLLLHPWLILKVLWDDVARLHYILEILAPLAFLSLWEMPVLLVAAPTLLINIMSSYSTTYLTGSRYPAMIIPFVFIAAIIGVQKLALRGGEPPPYGVQVMRILRYPLALTLLCTLLINPTPLRIRPGVEAPWIMQYPHLRPHQQKILALAKQFPPGASIATQSGIYHHLCNRKEVYCGFSEGVDYIFVDTKSRWFTEQASWSRDLQQVRDRGEYVPVFSEDYIFIYLRRDLVGKYPSKFSI
jgi:uncharacterized membrane protein